MIIRINRIYIKSLASGQGFFYVFTLPKNLKYYLCRSIKSGTAASCKMDAAETENHLFTKKMNIESKIQHSVIKAIKGLYAVDVTENTIQLQNTRKDFQGDITLVVFPFTRFSRKSPEDTAGDLGVFLKDYVEEVVDYNVVKGFLNLEIGADYWIGKLKEAWDDEKYGTKKAGEDSELVMVEYSSPNTNKPLHLGHIRNNLLGYSVCEILGANGYKVVKTNIVNDRGIH